MMSLGKDGFHWFVGEVVSVDDPLELGRVQVRCFGWYSDDIDKNYLPWALVGAGTSNASLPENVNTPSGLEIGSWVWGFFMDGSRAQEPFVVSSIPNKSAVVTEPEEKTYTSSELTDPRKPVYPDNKVMLTKSGHRIEFDNTSGSERINIQHKSGSSVEFHPDGKIVISSDAPIHIDGKAKISIDTSSEVVVNSSKVYLNEDTQIEGNLDVSGTITGEVVKTSSGISLGTHKHPETGSITKVPV